MKLKQLQREFRRCLTDAGETAGACLPGASAAGLAVHVSNYRAQLVRCLNNSYPKLRAAMGETAFLHAAARHITGHPPHAWTLDAYADGFCATLEALFPDNPDLHELAWIELALGTAFVAPDAPALMAAELAAVDWDRVLLDPTPSLRMRSMRTNAADIWHAMEDGTVPPAGAMLEQPGALVVWRRGHVACLRSTDAIEREALAALQVDGSFAALCAMLSRRLGDEPGIARAGSLLAHWIDAGLLAGIRHEGGVPA